ncbi:MAG: hypothetical protein KJ970_13930 [Candidatus Eisenbacteria bacterium]|uniref:Uncharacterized protein n=1 Tax=Eiseniibacteriota bacterium TaxID=2212470 RepID=A0A948S1B2_UNCEI|nr:hypothetical protein [Candidatus Eisenbacteria bacterium]MBU2692014.1 hypothetical protein [Candidatus Eisenbacteria bacterium]
MDKPTTETQLRKWLEKELRGPVLKPIWKYLVDGAYVLDALVPHEPRGLDNLLEAARKFNAMLLGYQPGRKRNRVQKSRVQALLPKAEILRAQVTANYLARMAAYAPGVLRFRKVILDGKTLTTKQAGVLLDSEAPRIFGLSFFKKHEIPLVGQNSWIVFYGKNGQVRPMYSPKNSMIEIQWKGHNLDVPYDRDLRLRMDDDKTPQLTILGHRFTPLPPKRGFHRGSQTSVLPGSIFAELREASLELTEAFGWHEEDATWFVLTEDPPQSSPLEVEPEGMLRHDHHRLRLRITVDPWVSPKTLMNVYQYLQKQSTGRQSHRFSERNLMLVDEVSEQIHKHDPVPSWRELMRLWNRAHPDLAYDHPQRFHRDFRRTAEKLIIPEYFWPWFAPKKKTKPKK